MTRSAKPILVDRRVSFQTPDDETIHCQALWLWNSHPLRIRLELSWNQWEAVQSAALFGTETVERPAALSSNEPVVIDGHLRPGRETIPDSPKSIRKQFSNPRDVLRQSESWVATSVRQLSLSAGGQGTEEETTAETDLPRVKTTEFTVETTTSMDGTSTEEDIDDPKTGNTDSRRISPALEPVVASLNAENRPFEVIRGGDAVSLTATVDPHEWDVCIEPIEDDAQCRIVSTYPDPVSSKRHEPLRAQFDTYHDTINRGGFELDRETGTIRFVTPFDPTVEPVSDALGENVTAMAEWAHLFSS